MDIDMGEKNCKYPRCEEDRRSGEGAYSDKFCSDEHEVKYDHLKADAADARRESEEEYQNERRDLPEASGPPY